MARKNNTQIRAKKAPNTTLEKLCQGKNAQIRAKNAPNTTLQKL